eukprot:2816039-Pleurochrysis_carterae.AAC.1
MGGRGGTRDGQSRETEREKKSELESVRVRVSHIWRLLERELSERGGKGEWTGTSESEGDGSDLTDPPRSAAQVSLEKVCELRGAMMGIPDELAARMPLAYVHFTHFLVDTLLVLAPLSLYPKLGVFSILITGIITLFFRGLLELSKSFLDPFGNRRVSSSGLSAELGVDVLLGESNAGSLLWPKGAVRMPFATSNMA